VLQSNYPYIDINLGLMIFPARNPDKEHQVLILPLIDLLSPLVKQLLILTGNLYINLPYNNVKVFNVKAPVIRVDKRNESVLSKISRFLRAQYTLCLTLIQKCNKVNIIICYLSPGLLTLPIFLSRILGKKVVIITTGSGSQSLRQTYPGWRGAILAGIAREFEDIEYRLANNIIVYSEALIPVLGLKRFAGQSGLGKNKGKILIAHEHSIDFDNFNIRNRLNERENVVGYIGRLSQEKGVMNFLEAIPIILGRQKDLKFIIVGDGHLRQEIERYLNDEKLTDKVKLIKFVPHEEVSNYLNELKLLLLPSYTEGLPNIVLESMACGTPVLATEVGGIPDFIADGECGFIMESNSPDYIARNVIRVLDDSRLEQVAFNAYNLVKSEFTRDQALKGYRDILMELSA
jgi:glycosyltransferase involved in cell wall biosynthesis